ncbi:MAG: UDP-N-acetylmuramoyl-L-alanyl-D-glutamate--2,6-diaminopimelate ligase, partial [Deltaproteobacteria bacterium]|nr:UDP-N-acetylmuramoyl-L-alanyl-D-glutamate--2,6-diaminopimelate ligase [Deltaproteobacteria bacterium]
FDMKLADLLEDSDIQEVSGDTSVDITDIYYDSRGCSENSLFVAIRGLLYDGHNFISHAVKKGARYIVHEQDVTPEQKAGATFIRVPDSRRALGKLGKRFYKNPSSELCLVGVTGTNGKTTVTYFLESIMKKAGLECGVVGTINYRYGANIYDAPQTTPESLDLQRILREMVDAGVTHAVMEVSSHAIDQGRVRDCEFDIGIFTNLSQDHLDYHETMEGYFDAKKKYFQEQLKEDAKILINVDDPWGAKLLSDIGKPVMTYGIDTSSDVSVSDFELSIDGIEAEVKAGDKVFTLRTPVIGRFNLYNILAATAAALCLDVPEESIKAGIEELLNIPGRLEKVSGPGEPPTFVDYAHTEDALKKVLENLTDFKRRRIITVFGCGGDRDRTKRPLMGKAATDLSDIAIVTSDNPRTEDPLDIIDDIERGIDRDHVTKFSLEEIASGIDKKGYTVLPDRLSAIELAISVADIGDIVLIAGKGHEDYQILGKERIFFDDRVYAKEVLARRPWEGNR